MDFKLGKLPRTLDKRTPWVENFLDFSKLPPLMDEVDWNKKVSKRYMLGNDIAGDCVEVAYLNRIQTATANAGRRELTFTTAQALQVYSDVTGYDPMTGANDNGTNMLSFLKYCLKTGALGHKLGAFAAINPKNILAMRYTAQLFGGIYMGLDLPISAQKQKVWGRPPGGWVGNGEPGSWGGHCVDTSYITDDLAKADTWAIYQPMTVDFIITCCDEAYALFGLEWFGVNHKTPHGFAWQDMLSDIRAVQRMK